MKLKSIFIALFYIYSNTAFSQSIQFKPGDINIPYKKYVLENGLRLIVHEDHKAPIVAVNVWYYVGSKNEKPGKSGFAHLFEHLMFNGSEHYNFDYFKALEAIGATDLNGTTNFDRTNYFQNIPLAGLDQVLWLESDRMGHLLGSINQAKLDEQRGVVQNEKRQGENQPYGKEFEMMTKACYPAHHPYSWTVIGSMEDLNAASLDDVKNWFNSYYGASNAVIVIAGDVQPEEILEKVKRNFGSIPAGPPTTKFEKLIAKRTENTRQSYSDRVTEPRISMYWNVPGWGTKEAALLDIVADLLTNGKTSRLYKKLMYEEQVAAYVFSYNWSKEISGTFNVTVNVKPGGDHQKVEDTANRLLKDFLDKGPTLDELSRVKSKISSGFVKGLERIGGFGGKSDVLAENEVFGNNPDFYKTYLKWINEATAEEVRKAAKDWLSEGKHTIVCTPFPNYKNSTIDVDRSKLPPLSVQPESSFPDIQTTVLKNGLKIVLAQRKGAANIAMDMIFKGGFSVDFMSKPGISAMAMNLMDEGTTNLNTLQINEKLQSLGTDIGTFAELDAAIVRMDALQQSFAPSLDLFADMILHPSFPDAEFKRLKQEQLVTIKREQADPNQIAQRVFPKILYGNKHPYGIPVSGSGYERTVEEITREEIQKYYATWLRPNNATLVVVGDLDMKSLVGAIETRFGLWKKDSLQTNSIATVAPAKGNKLYFLDRPGSEQSVIVAGYLTAPYGKLPEIEREALMNIFGNDFTSRLNMNLREDKHWSYGARSFVIDASGPRTLLVSAPVQTDKTKESIAEIRKEFKEVLDTKPITLEEFERTRSNVELELPGRWETNGSVRASLDAIAKYNLPQDYYKTYGKKVKAMNLVEVQKLSRELLQEEHLSWFVVGDKQKIFKGLQESGFSELIQVDADGNVLP